MAGDEFVVLLDNKVRFTTTQPVGVEDVIESLRGMDKIVRAHFPKAIKKLTGASVKSAELQVTAIEDGSLIQDTVVKLIFGNLKQKDKFIKSVRNKFVSKNKAGETVVKGWVAGTLLAAVAIIGIAYWQGIGMGDGAPQGGLVTVNGDNNVVMTIGAEAYKTKPEQFEKAVDSALTHQQKISAAKAGVQMFSPSRSQGGAGLDLMEDGQSLTVVSPDTVSKMPDKIGAEDNSQDAAYPGVEIKFRASDSDSNSRGWAGTIDLIVENRTRIVFANPKDSLAVMYKPSVKADVTVTFSDAARTKPILIIVERVY